MITTAGILHTHGTYPRPCAMYTYSTCTCDLQQHTLHIYSTYPHTRVDTHTRHAHPHALQIFLTWTGALSKHYLLTGLGFGHLQLIPFSSFFDLEWLETCKVFPGKKMEKPVCPTAAVLLGGTLTDAWPGQGSTRIPQVFVERMNFAGRLGFEASGIHIGPSCALST